MTTTPFPDESFQSLLSRWAAANYVDSPHTVTRDAGMAYAHVQSQLFSHANVRIVSNITGLDEGDLIRRSMPHGEDSDRVRMFFGSEIPKCDIGLTYRRFAPAALRQAPYHRALWSIRSIPYCTETWQALTDACPRCDKRQRWERGYGPDVCDRCHTSLDLAEADLADHDVRVGLLRAAALIDPNPSARASALSSLPSALQQLGSSMTYELLTHLACHAKAGKVLRRVALSQLQPRELARRISEGAGLLQDWPRTFFEQIKVDALGRTDGERLDLHYARALLKSRTSRLSSKLAAHLDQLVAALDPVRADGLRDRWYSRDRFNHVVSIRGAKVHEMLRTGELKSHLVFSSQRWMVWYDGREADDLRRMRETSSSIQTVARTLGMSVCGVEQLLDMGVLSQPSHPFFLKNYSLPRICNDGVEALLARLEPSRRSLPEGMISLRKIMTKIGGRPKPWGAAVRLLLSKAHDVHVVAEGKALSDRLMVPSTVASRILNLESGPSKGWGRERVAWMSLSDVEEYLNVTPKMVGAVVADLQYDERDKAHAFAVTDIHRLGSKMISTIEIAARTGLRASIFMKEVGLGSLPQIRPGMYERDNIELVLSNKVFSHA